MLILRRTRTLLSVYFAEMVEYRIELFFWMIATALPLMMMGIWVPAAENVDLPISAGQIARYYLALFVIRQFTIAWVVYHFEFHVVTGRLSPLLLQPLDPILRFLHAHFSEQWARLPLVIAMTSAVILIYPQSLGTEVVAGNERIWRPAWLDVLRVIPLIYGAFLLRYCLQCIFCMLSFWVERGSRIEHIFFLPYMYLSGLFAPLEVFDESVRRIVMWTPFPYMMWFPANILIGRESETIPYWQGVGMMAMWTAIFFVTYRILWRIGLKKYSAMGA